MLFSGRNVILNKWVFKIKRGSDGEIIRYKVRLVVRGFSQKAGKDYDEIFVFVVKFLIMRMLLVCAVYDNLNLL